MMLALLTTLTFIMPLRRIDDTLLPMLVPLGAYVYDATDTIVATAFAFPGSFVAVQVGECGSWTVRAWIIENNAISEPAGPVTKSCGGGCGTSCHL